VFLDCSQTREISNPLKSFANIFGRISFKNGKILHISMISLPLILHFNNLKNFHNFSAQSKNFFLGKNLEELERSFQTLSNLE